jgi:pyruvate dehydrogenase E2 component (dihydrolipoamide acetyltransferase)
VGDSLAVIETDKASMDFEAQDDGVVARLLVSAGTENVSVGAAIMVTVEDAGDVGAFANFAAGTAPSSAVTATTPLAAAAPPAPPAAPSVAAAAAQTTPVAAAVAPPKAAAPITAPAATPPGVASSGGSEWGKLAARGSPLAKMMAVKQREYVKKYGSTGHVPVV